MVKFAHISDIHLGYMSGKKIDPVTKINIREQDGYLALEECFKDIASHADELDFVLCTGDFFHSPTPSIRTITKGLELLRILTQSGLPFYCLAGNHDSTDAVKDIPSSKCLHIPEINSFSYTEPYKIVEPIEGVLLHLVSHHGYVEQKNTMKKVLPVNGKINILCTHGSVYDEHLGMILHTEAEPREIVISEDLLNRDWDYTLLGHIHTRGWVGSSDGINDTMDKKVFYAGSLFRRGFSDPVCKLERGWTMWDLNVESKEMKPTFFNTSQRLQIDMMFECNNKSISTIETELEIFFKSIDLNKQPILRITLMDLSKTSKQQINWKRFEQYTSQCLTFITKLLTKEEAKAKINGEVFSFDLLSAFREYWDIAQQIYSEDIREQVCEVSNKLLRQGQEKILELKNK